MSSLISVLAQNFKDYDIYFIHNIGNGTDVNTDSYKEYYALTREYGINSQLSPYDPRTKEVCNIKRDNIFELSFENDHNLDSGAWYKFIKTKKWQNYDYVLFMGEGALLTYETVITDTLNFCVKNNAHFVSGAQDKRCLPKELFLNINSKDDPSNKYYLFHDRMTKEVFDIFCRDKAFKDIFDAWRSDFKTVTENHVPDFLGYIYVNCARKRLKSLADIKREGNVKFHKENGQEWFGCCCNFLLSKELLTRLSEKLEKNNIHDFLKLPFSADALEVIWGFIPLWLGFDKWFFNGIHRVRKNFVNYKREDGQRGLSQYLNQYYSGKIKTVYKEDFIKIVKINKNLEYLKETLNSYYF